MPVPSPGDLPDPEIKPESLALQADYLQSESPGKPITSLELQRQMIDALIVQLLAMLLANASLWLTQGRLLFKATVMGREIELKFAETKSRKNF